MTTLAREYQDGCNRLLEGISDQDPAAFASAGCTVVAGRARASIAEPPRYRDAVPGRVGGRR